MQAQKALEDAQGMINSLGIHDISKDDWAMMQAQLHLTEALVYAMLALTKALEDDDAKELLRRE